MTSGQGSGATNQRRAQVIFTCKLMSDIASGISLMCSALGTFLFVGILMGLAKTLDGKSLQTVIGCSHNLLTAATVFGCLAVLLYIFVKYGKQSDLVKIQEIAQRHQNQAGLFQDESNLRQGFDNTGSQQLYNELKNSKEKNVQTSATANLSEAAKDIKTTSQSSRNPINHSALFLKPGNFRINPNRSDKSSRKDKIPEVQNQLVLANKLNFPSFEQYPTPGISSQVSNCWNFSTQHKLENAPVTEVVATRKVRFFDEGNIERQEEIQLKRTTTIYRCPETGQPLYKASLTNFDQCNNKEFRTRHTPSHEPEKNQFSDVITQFQSLKFLH